MSAFNKSYASNRFSWVTGLAGAAAPHIIIPAYPCAVAPAIALQLTAAFGCVSLVGIGEYSIPDSARSEPIVATSPFH
jgi:hypothetical protein